MLFKISTILLFCFSLNLLASSMQEGDLYKEKQSLITIKDELNDFYEQKELEYQKNKKELETIEKKIKSQEDVIKQTKIDNQKILDEINRVITSKAMLIYDKMKLGTVINIFNEMIQDGRIDEVFDIMTRLKTKRVMKILKKFDVKTSTIIMEKLRIDKDK